MTAKELRQKYLDFFKLKGHAVIPSASLIPENDPSVLFTTAGMHPLIPYLMGEKHPGGKKVVNVQKCIRTADIDEVGDNRHLTFFEMLGNWSFGDYFKEKAIEWSFEFLTDKKIGLGLEPKRLYVTVFKGEQGIPRDEEAIKIWQETFSKAGIKAEVAKNDEIIKDDIRIIPLGVEDNFWIAGATGPCGGDTEMFYDVRSDDERKKEEPISGKFSEIIDAFDIIEIWNNVFMEFNKTAEGKYEKLAKPNVDTGMGVERTLATLLEKNSVFETELFLPILKEIEKISRKIYDPYLDKLMDADSRRDINKYSDVKKSESGILQENINNAFRIIADHIKASVFMISDGVAPLNVGRGYVLRRLIRRAVRYGKILGIENNFTIEIAKVVVEIYKDFYPELGKNKNKIFEELEKEENKFRQTLEIGIKEYERVDHFIQIIRLDVEKLKKSLEFIRENSFQQNLSLIELKEEFVKRYLNYEPFKKIFKYYNDNLKKYLTPLRPLNEKEFKEIKESLETSKFIFEEMEKVLKNIRLNGVFTFYLYQTSGLPFEIIKEIATEKGLEVNEKEFEEELKKHQELSRTASAGMFKGGLADASEKTTKLHTAAHLMLAALRQVLGTQVLQRGSNITEERLRFDFSHNAKLTPEQIAEVEKIVNEQIQKKLPVVCEEMTLEEAKKQGAMGIFESKYGEKVKVYTIGDFSKEICGGPHVQNTGELGKFKIKKEESSSAGVRRIKAVLE